MSERKLVVQEETLPATFGEVELEMPFNSWVTHIAEQNGRVCLWFMFRPENMARYGTTKRRFLLLPTGKEYKYDDASCYLMPRGTVLLQGGATVVHVFEIVSATRLPQMEDPNV